MKKYILPLVIVSIFSCNKGNDDILIIDPRSINGENITLSVIADEIEYIPLDDSIPFISFKYVLTPNSIYVSAKGVGILKFDKEGRLIKKIGSKGRGPGEFWYGMDFTVDEKSGTVYILDPMKVKVYSQSGYFIKDILVGEYLSGYGMGRDIEFYNSLLFIPDYLSLGTSKYSWVFLDTLGNLISSKKNTVPPFQTNIEMNGSVYKFGNKLFYYNYYNDTIFTISDDLSSKAAYLFGKGDYRWPLTRIDLTPQTQLLSTLYKLFKPGTMFETKHFIMLEYEYLDKWAIFLIEKETKNSFLAFKMTEDKSASFACIINDLDGGLPLYGDINYYVENDVEYLTTLIPPIDLKLYVSGDEFKSSVPKYPEKKIEVEKLANSLTETDNPVLMIVRLKE